MDKRVVQEVRTGTAHPAMKRILLVEDNRRLLDAISEVLESEGWAVFATTTGSEATALIENLRFDAAIIDLKLPDTNGAEVLGRLWERQPGIRPIIITAYPDSHLMQRVDALAAGWFTLVEKPFRVDVLLEILRVTLSNAR